MAQDAQNPTPEIKSLTKYKLYILGTGFEREQKISKQSSIYFGAAIEVVVPFHPQQPAYASDILRIDNVVNFAPVLSFGYRNYYNLVKRQKALKTVENNSANYFGTEYNLITPILINKRYTTNFVHSFSPVWGFQNNIMENVNTELAIGPSFQTDFKHSRVSVLFRFGFNYLL